MIPISRTTTSKNKSLSAILISLSRHFTFYHIHKESEFDVRESRKKQMDCTHAQAAKRGRKREGGRQEIPKREREEAEPING